MSEKTYIFDGGDNGQNGLLASILPALQNRGVDTAALLAAMGNGNGGFFGNNGGFQDIIALIVIAAIFGNGNGFGFGNGGNNNSAERELLANMIQRNGTDLSQLAQTLGCSNSRIVDAIGEVSTQICNLAGQNGQSFMQVINAIQAGNTSITSQICSCCCDLKQLLCNQTNTLQNAINSVAVGQERGFSNVAYATAQQTCDLQNTIKDSTAQILAGQAAIEKRELQNRIDALREENGTYKASAMTSQIVAQAIAPLSATLSAVKSDVDCIKCNSPEVAKVPYSPVVGVPACVAAQYGLYGGLPYGTGTGFFG